MSSDENKGWLLETSPSESAPVADLSEAGREQIKLRSNWLNGISIATFAVGTLAPMTRAFFDDVLSWKQTFASLALAVICLVISGVLHSVAKRNLRELDR
ncbi:hypothetical protein [Jiella marina]|uniref:hypothetical protein n=1 Tax=Jiella sp. LLJ827 TaxID=2917712 RepID=UPI0021015DA0|nr:hypothetical protein [Jiella sp. LLJ827]MCQ0987384.1 hypothetical protein [Jiella sp. LLJ827]